MVSNHSEQNKHGIAHFAALKTAIANGEVSLIKTLLSNESMNEIEKSYLIDLAQVRNNETIMALLKAIPVNKN
jgi:hypothetical protein